MSSTRVSYVLTTKNRADFFARTLENIAEFKTKRDELIVVDGGSTDHTKKIARKNKALVDVFISEADRGEAHALNKGFLLAKGKFIKLLTDDDYFYPKSMRRAIQVMEKNPEIDALQCGGEAYIIDEKTGERRILFYEQIDKNVKIASDLLHLMTYAPCGLGLIFRREILPIIGLIDTKYRAVDLNLLSRLVECKLNLKYLNIDLYQVTIYPHSGTKYVEDIWRDEGKTLLRMGMWRELLGKETRTIALGLGIQKLPGGMAVVSWLKLIDQLRRSPARFLVEGGAALLSIGQRLRLLYLHLKHQFIQVARGGWSNGASPALREPQRPKRDGKFW